MRKAKLGKVLIITGLQLIAPISPASAPHPVCARQRHGARIFLAFNFYSGTIPSVLSHEMDPANVIESRLLNFPRMRIMKHNSQHSFPATRLRHETTHSAALQTFLLQLSHADCTGAARAAKSNFQ